MVLSYVGMKSTQFTTEERKLLIEVLLFAASADICAEWTPAKSNLMIELAKKLNDPIIKLDDIYLFEGGLFDNEKVVEDISKEFPNLPRTSVITD